LQPIQWSPAVEKSSDWLVGSGILLAEKGRLTKARERPRFAAIADSRAASPANRRTFAALGIRLRYSLASATAIFCEMYPSTTPMIIEMTMLMNGLSSEAMVTEPSLLPAKASPAVVA
jgi:hypothetical protein